MQVCKKNAKALSDAVQALKDAEGLVKTTQAELKVAQATYKKADDEITATRKVIAKLEATKYLTPDAQKHTKRFLKLKNLQKNACQMLK